MNAVRQDADRPGPGAIGDLGRGDQEVQKKNLKEYARNAA
jgi:hypothetical protein